jgi:hypothetical protein
VNVTDRPEFDRLRYACFPEGVMDRTVEIYDSLTDRERLLMEIAWERGRNTVVADLQKQLGLGSTFTRASLDRWVERATEYYNLLTDADAAEVSNYAAHRELENHSDWGPIT